MHKQYLMAPGPTPVPERARLAMARQLIHHRGDQFREVMADVRQGLSWLFETESDVLCVQSSGTGAFEAAMTNFTSRGDTVVVIGGGKFGERWGDVGRAYDMNVVDVDVEWGEYIRPERLGDILDEHPDTAMVTLTASETSTAVFHPVQQLAQVVRNRSNALVAVDGITAVGVHRLPMDDWDIDILVAGSQKAFGIPPGLGFVAAGPRAWARHDTSDHPRYYFDLAREKQRQADNQTAFTSAISVTLALREVLSMMRDEGRRELLERHRRNAEATRQGVKALGLKLLSSRPSNAVTAAVVPDEIGADNIVQMMRDEQGITIAGGQKHLSGSIIRIGHIGFYEPADIRVGLGALEAVMAARGQDVQAGSALEAAQRVFMSGDETGTME